MLVCLFLRPHTLNLPRHRTLNNTLAGGGVGTHPAAATAQVDRR